MIAVLTVNALIVDVPLIVSEPTLKLFVEILVFACILLAYKVFGVTNVCPVKIPTLTLLACIMFIVDVPRTVSLPDRYSLTAEISLPTFK